MRVAIPELETTDPADLDEFNDLLRRLVLAFNGLVGFGDGTTTDNIDGQWASVADTGTANTEFEATHTLQRVPSGFLVMNIDKAGIVYDSGTTWTTTKLYLKCSAANAALVLFVL